MNKKFEKLVSEIMKECEMDGEPVTREQAEEMAKMETNSKEKRHFETSSNKRKVNKVRKVDEEKALLLKQVEKLIAENGGTSTAIKTETELSFSYCGNDYSFKLIKHRPPKK